MTDIRKAGTMILENLEMFNEAVILYKTKIHTEVGEELNTVIENWAKECNWKVEDAWGSAGECIAVAPPDWDIERSWFELYYLDESEISESSFMIADLCGVGENKFVFQFKVEYRSFGGRTEWNRIFRSVPNEITKKISNCGFSYKNGIGDYYLPVSIDCKKLAIAWNEEDYADVFEPITVVLDKLKNSKTHFDDLLTFMAREQLR